MAATSRRLAPALAFLLTLASGALGEDVQPLDLNGAQWIWAPAGTEGRDFVFRRTFDLTAPAAYAQVVMTADFTYELVVNGTVVGRDGDWSLPERYEVTNHLKTGRNVLAVHVVGHAEHPGLLLAFRSVGKNGELVQLVSDSAWQATPTVAGWGDSAAADQPGAAARELGPYGAMPWGRLTRLSSEETERAMAEAAVPVPSQAATSTFAAAYLDPSLAAAFAAPVRVDRASGRFALPAGPAALLFVRYAQTAEGGLVTSPASFDFDRFEQDLAQLAALGLQPALGGFGWADLLNADGTWRAVGAQPAGAGLPAFRYAYEVLSYALDRVQAHGLHALALLDYRYPLPTASLPEGYRDKLLVSSQLWRNAAEGQAKIARLFAGRPVLLGYTLFSDALPGLPSLDEPVVRERLLAAAGRVEGDLPIPFRIDPSTAAIYQTMYGQLLTERLNELSSVLRAAAPQQLLVFGTAGDPLALLDPATLAFDLVGTFGYDPQPAAPVTDHAVPSYTDTLAAVHAVRGLDGTPVAGVMAGRLGVGLPAAQAARQVRHEWVDVIGQGGAGLLAAPAWPRLAGAMGPSESLALASLGSLVAATETMPVTQAPQVLVLRNRAMAWAGAQAADARAARRVGELLERLHLRYDLAALDQVGAPGEPGRIDLERYQAVVVPSLAQVPSDAVWQRLSAWVADGAAGQRVLLLGGLGRHDARMRERELPPALAALVGGASAGRPMEGWAASDLFVQPPLAPLPTGRRLAWPAAGAALSSLGDDSSLTPIGWLRVSGGEAGIPVLAQRSHERGVVVTAAYNLGLGEVESLPPAVLDSLSSVLGSLLSHHGVVPFVAAPGNVAVYRSDDGRRVLVKERLGRSGDQLWTTSAAAPQTFWVGATTDLLGNGTARVSAPLVPYEVKLLHAAGELHGVTPQQVARLRANTVREGVLNLSVTAPDLADLRLYLQPGVNLMTRVGDANQVRQVAPDGTLDIPVPGARPTSVQVGGPAPAGARAVPTPEDFMVVGDYYRERGEFTRAMNEYTRLTTLYAGSPVAALAQQRRAQLLATSGAVVWTNLARWPLTLQLQGPASSEEVSIAPGEQHVFILPAGTYTPVRTVTDASLPLMLPPAENVTVTAGQVVTATSVVAVPSKPDTPDPAYNLRLKLAADEQAQAELAGRMALGLPATTAAPGAGAAAEGGAQAVALQPGLTGPPLTLETDMEETASKRYGEDTRVFVRNATSQDIELTVSHAPPPPAASDRRTIELAPGRTFRIRVAPTGDVHVFGKVLSNNQDYHFGIHPSNGSNYQFVLREVTPEQLAQRAEIEARRRQSSQGGRLGGDDDRRSNSSNVNRR